MATPPKEKKWRGWKWLLGGVALGAAGLAVTAFVLDATDQRTFCATCHYMGPAAVTQKMSTHLNLTCNDCHLPNSGFIEHYAFKAYIGANDVIVNTFGSLDLPVMANGTMKGIINDNCIRCHTGTNMNVESMNAKPYCTDCHRNVPHMNKKPVSTRMVAYE